jgi:hypothetical protein
VSNIHPRRKIDFDFVHPASIMFIPGKENLQRQTGWLVRAIARERTIRQTPPGEWLRIPYARLGGYCPQSIGDEFIGTYEAHVFEQVGRAGLINLFLVPQCVSLAAEEELISVRRNPGKAHGYRLLKHPVVKAIFNQARLLVMPETKTQH